jgi:hypothetical protein
MKATSFKVQRSFDFGLSTKMDNGKKTPLNDILIDILYACCGKAHVFSSSLKKGNNGRSGRRCVHLCLKLVYYDRPMMLTDNVDVEYGLANGSMCNVREVVLSDVVILENLERILIDGY